jgi:hypothetical protein
VVRLIVEGDETGRFLPSDGRAGAAHRPGARVRVRPGNHCGAVRTAGPTGARADSTFVRPGFGTKDEVTRAFSIDVSGRYVIRLIIEGDETGSFCLDIGGSALPNGKPPRCPSRAPAAADALSTSIFEPSPIGSGIVTGKLPGGEAVQFYYLFGELTPASLRPSCKSRGAATAADD